MAQGYAVPGSVYAQPGRIIPASVGPGASTPTNTQPAKARVQVTATKTQTAKARITNTATKIQTAVAHVGAPGALSYSQPAKARVQVVGLTATQAATANIFVAGVSSTITGFKFTRAVVYATDGRATLAMTDLNGWPTTADGLISVTANDNGSIAGLTTTQGTVYLPATIAAYPIAVGTAVVTVFAYQNGRIVSGTLNVTVTSTGGRLQAAWSSGSITAY